MNPFTAKRMRETLPVALRAHGANQRAMRRFNQFCKRHFGKVEIKKTAEGALYLVIQ